MNGYFGMLFTILEIDCYFHNTFNASPEQVLVWTELLLKEDKALLSDIKDKLAPVSTSNEMRFLLTFSSTMVGL